MYTGDDRIKKPKTHNCLLTAVAETLDFSRWWRMPRREENQDHLRRLTEKKHLQQLKN